MSHGWDEDQRSRVGRLSRYARQRPGAYRRRVVVLALIGYGLLFSIFAGSLLLVSLGPALGWWLGGAVGLAIGVGGTLLGLGSVRWWGLGTKPPPGVELSRSDHPELFERLDTLRDELGSVRIHRLHLDDSTTASVIQLPRARVFGVNENHLVLGLPLVSALSPDALDAVLAHELAHVRRGWSLGAWIWRARRVFRRVTDIGADGRRWRPSTWAARFEVFSGALAREFELEADARAARLVGATSLGHALCQQVLVDARVAEWRLRRNEARPPEDRTESLIREASHLDSARDRRRLGVALFEPEYRVDTHPSLRERLDAIGVVPGQPPLHPGPSGAEHYFGWRASEYAAVLSRRWAAREAAEWGTRAEAYRAEIQALRREWSLVPRAFLPEGRLRTLVETALALGVLHELPQVGFDSLPGPDAAFVRGDYVAATHSLSLLVRAAALTALAEREPDGSGDWLRALASLEAEHALASDERKHLDDIAYLVAPVLDTETRLALTHRLRREAGTRRAWLVQRKVRYLPEHPEHIVFVDLEPRLSLAPARQNWPDHLMGVRVVVLRGPMRRLHPRLSRIPGAVLNVN